MNELNDAYKAFEDVEKETENLKTALPKRKRQPGNRESKVVSSEKVTIINQQGEVIEETKTDTYSRRTEPPYVKLYARDIGKLFGLTATENDLFHELMTKVMSFQNILCLTGPIRKMITTTFGISTKTLERTIKSLKDKSLIIPLEVEGEKKRGWYVLNPEIAAKGDWADIRELRLTVAYAIEHGEPVRYMSLGCTDQKGETIMSPQFQIPEIE